jgi:hypothetical protein
MDRDTIIRLAIEAKLVCDWDGGCASAWVEGHDLTPYLERFAALVAEQDTALLRQALEALEKMLDDAKHECVTVTHWNDCVDTITALRERLGEKT